MVAKFTRQLEEGVLSFLLVFMTLLVFIEVVLRFGFNTGIHWAQELTLHASAWFVLFGISYGVKVGAHIGVDAVVRLLSPPVKRLVSIVAVLLCLLYCVLILMGAWVYLAKVYKIGLAMEDMPTPSILMALIPESMMWDTFKIDEEEPLLPMWFAHGPLLIGFLLLAYRFLEVLKKLVTGEWIEMHMADEAKEALEEQGIDADKVNLDDMSDDEEVTK
ncbi:putative C4-dicarboxylate transporter [Candidatus Terasakiella magnetica]|uniref:TRAP transporter small permease protein n=1 Tax=Candidatus Terasakiella magnetica TaxID=1867952 RepID=A0A1C3RI35_9PROT|nr:TRAP transporter small permease [Candidatus Terasakiella magnetica]SCA56951.1 putative C4-dicarboxylate transporter [Candidatus Terasakiella magnetica]